MEGGMDSNQMDGMTSKWNGMDWTKEWICRMEHLIGRNGMEWIPKRKEERERMEDIRSPDL